MITVYTLQIRVKAPKIFTGSPFKNIKTVRDTQNRIIPINGLTVGMKNVFEWDDIFFKATGYYSGDNYIIFKPIKKAGQNL